ncbi:hypothetical protein HZA98_01845 [Candidatus Woesearchaeota archaeon]|nr:hypothetical protein [Candidatus Woesearchaeota archaeon]
MAEQEMQVDFTQAFNEMANRLRVLESKQNLFSEKLLVMNQNMIEEYKKTTREVKVLDMEIKDLKKDLENIKNIVRHLTDEAGRFAKQSDLKVLEKYIKLWNPMSFVTEKDVQKLIDEALHGHKDSVHEEHAHGHTSESSARHAKEGSEE